MNETDPNNIMLLLVFDRKDFDNFTKYIFTIIFISVFTIGLIGNVLTCIVILVGPAMRTPLNYYLFNLAVADIIHVTLNVLTVLLNLWMPFYNPLQINGCFLENYVAEVALEVSLLTITGLTIERYQAIRNPFKAQTKSRAIKIIIGLWIAAAIVSYLPASQYYLVRNGPEAVCIITPAHMIEILIALSTIFFVLPLPFIIVLYSLIVMILMKSSKIKLDMIKNTSKRIDSTIKKSLQISVAVVVAYFLCFSPFYVTLLIRIYIAVNPNSIPELTRFFIFNSVARKLMINTTIFFCVLSGAINPIIYNVVSKKFRGAFMETLIKISGRKRIQQQLSKSTTTSEGSRELPFTIT